MDKFKPKPVTEYRFAAIDADQGNDIHMHDQMEQNLTDLLHETSSILFWGLILSKTKILEGKAKYPHRSKMDKGVWGDGCCSGIKLGALDACEGGI